MGPSGDSPAGTFPLSEVSPPPRTEWIRACFVLRCSGAFRFLADIRICDHTDPLPPPRCLETVGTVSDSFLPDLAPRAILHGPVVSHAHIGFSLRKKWTDVVDFPPLFLNLLRIVSRRQKEAASKNLSPPPLSHFPLLDVDCPLSPFFAFLIALRLMTLQFFVSIFTIIQTPRTLVSLAWRNVIVVFLSSFFLCLQSAFIVYLSVSSACPGVASFMPKYSCLDLRRVRKNPLSPFFFSFLSTPLFSLFLLRCSTQASRLLRPRRRLVSISLARSSPP